MSPPRGGKATSHIVAGTVDKVLPNGYEFVVDGEHVKVTSSEYCTEEEGCVCADHYEIPAVGTEVRLRVGDKSGRITAVEEVGRGGRNGHGSADAAPPAAPPDPNKLTRADLLRARVEIAAAAAHVAGEHGAMAEFTPLAESMWAWVMNKPQPAAAQPARPAGDGASEAHTRPTRAETPVEDPEAVEHFWLAVLAAFDGEEKMAGAWLATAMGIDTQHPERVGLQHLRAWLRTKGNSLAELDARLEAEADIPFA